MLLHVDQNNHFQLWSRLVKFMIKFALEIKLLHVVTISEIKTTRKQHACVQHSRSPSVGIEFYKVIEIVYRCFLAVISSLVLILLPSMCHFDKANVFAESCLE